MSQLFTSGGQSTADSALASVLPMNIQGWKFQMTATMNNHYKIIRVTQIQITDSIQC